MAYVILEDGIPGVDWKTPIDPSWALYQMMLLREPGRLLTPQMVMTNNNITLGTKETALQRGIAGQATIPIFLTWNPKAAPEYSVGGQAVKSVDRINTLTEDLTGVRYFQMGSKGGVKERGKIVDEFFPAEEILPEALDPDTTEGKRAKGSDVDKTILALIRSISAALHPRTVYIPPKAVVRTWMAPDGYRYMGMDFKGFMENLDDMQQYIYDNYQANPPRGLSISLHAAGLSFVEKNDGQPKVRDKGFPGMTTKITQRTSIKYLLDVRQTKYNEERIMTLYTTPASAALRHFAFVDGYEPEDYAAWNAILHSMYSGYGSPSFENWLNARDINESIMLPLGTGIRRSDPLRGLNADFYTHMFDWALLFGLQLARAVPMSQTIDVRFDSNELRGYEKLQQFHANYVDMPNFGSKPDPHLIMPSNFIPDGAFALPCAVRAARHKEGWTDYTNKWEWMEGYEYPNMKQASITGDSELNIPFEDHLTKTWYRLTFQSDAEYGRTIRGLSQRPLMYWRFPITPLMWDEQTEEDRKLNWILSLMCYGSQLLQNGYRVQPFFKLLKGVRGKVRIWTDARGEARFVETDEEGRIKLDKDGKPIISEKVVPTSQAQSTEELPGSAIREKPGSMEKVLEVSVTKPGETEESETSTKEEAEES